MIRLLIIFVLTYSIHLGAQEFSDSELSNEIDQLESEIEETDEFADEAFEEGDEEGFEEDFEEEEENQEVAEEEPEEEVKEEEQPEEVAEEEPANEDDTAEELVEEQIAEEEPVDEIPQEELAPPEEPVEFASQNTEPDPPDLDFERKLHDIYINYHNQAMSDEKWSEIAGEKISQVYEIEKGDNLWGISKILFGDGHFWPKVWSLNGRITNPHLIQKGNSIRFLMGDEGSEPAFTIAEGVDPIEPDINVAEQVEEDVEIPEPTLVYRKVLKNLPPSFQFSKVDQSEKVFQSLGFAKFESVKTAFENKTYLDAYVLEDSPEDVGSVQEIEASLEFATRGQYVYLYSEKELVMDAKYTAFKNKGALVSPYDSVVFDEVFRFEVEGVVKVSDFIKEYDGGYLYRALVVYTNTAVSKNARIVKGDMTVLDLSVNDAPKQFKGQIIGGNFHRSRQIFNRGSKVFLDQGQEQGVSVGDIVDIYANSRLRNANSVLKKGFRKIARVKVLHTDKNFSTAIIVDTKSEVRTGDFTYNPLKADLASQ